MHCGTLAGRDAVGLTVVYGCGGTGQSVRVRVTHHNGATKERTAKRNDKEQDNTWVAHERGHAVGRGVLCGVKEKVF